MGFDFESKEIEIELHDFFDFDNIRGGDEFIGIINDHAVVGVFADGADVENILAAVDEGAS